jgi:hypothetical protein
VAPGQRMHITAKHDTYGISFAVRAEASASPAACEPAARVPLWVSEGLTDQILVTPLQRPFADQAQSKRSMDVRRRIRLGAAPTRS